MCHICLPDCQQVMLFFIFTQLWRKVPRYYVAIIRHKLVPFDAAIQDATSLSSNPPKGTGSTTKKYLVLNSLDILHHNEMGQEKDIQDCIALFSKVIEDFLKQRDQN